ncbi:MAG: hypothetical protein U0640_08785 [Phycisphaerales bacterium]
MNKAILGFLLLVAFAGGSLFFFAKHRASVEANKPPTVVLTEPPPGAPLIDVMVSPVEVAREPAFVGMWVPHPEGWPGTATKMTLESEGVAIRMWQPASIPSAGVWIIVYLEGVDSLSAIPFYEGAQVRVGGQVKSVDVVLEGTMPTPRLVIRPGYLYK